MKKQAKALITTGAVASLGLAAVPAIISATGVSGNVQLNTEVSTSIAMKIASPNDTNPDCMEQSGVTYGVANRYATSNGAEGSKQVDTFDGTPGGADELNTNTSCATLTMNPNAFSSTYSDITIYTNSPNGYSLTVRSADNTSPNLVNTTDPTQYIEAGALTESNGTTPGGQNKWALKSDTGLLDTWTPVATTDTTVRAYDQITNNGSNTRVTYGISSGNNPVGKYATTLTYTATMFDSAMNPEVPTANFSIGTGGGNTDPTAQITVPDNVTVPYKETRTVPVEVAPGYQIDSVTCTGGYECDNYNTGDDATGSQTIDITNNTKDNSGSIDITTKPIEYPVTVTEDVNNEPNSLTLSTSDLSVPYGQSRLVTVTPATGYYLAGVSCADGYVCTKEQTTTGSANASSTNNQSTLGGLFTANAYAAENDNAIETGEDAYQPQTIKVTNKNTLGGGTVSFKTAKRHFTISISGTSSDLSANQTSLSMLYGESATVTVTPSTGHYLASVSCPTGYTCTKEDGSTISTGDNATAQTAQTIKVTNNNTADNGTLTLAAGTSEYTVSVSGTNTTVSPTSISVPYGGSKTIDVTPSSHYYLSSVSCPSGYTCSGYNTGSSYTGKQTITVTNNNTTSGGSLTATSTIQSYQVAITPSVNATTSTNSLSVPYGGSKTFTITPVAGYYLTGITCSTGYTCSTPTYGSAADPNATSRGAQTITVTNNSTTSTGAVSFTLDNKYRISFSKTNISSPSEDYVDVAYGGQTTVTVTPASGYYLSAFSGCPSGWTCSGVSTGTSYTGNQTLTLKNNSSTNIGTITLAGTIVEYMQGFSCSSLSSGVTKTLRDSRDNKDYNVAKLKDGKCWMTQDLKLDGGRTLTSADSNVTTNFTLAADNSGTWCTENSSACDNQSLMTKQNAPHGYLYNWYAATAGSGTYSTAANVTVNSSICPKGWKLPTKDQYVALDQAYGGNGTNRKDATQRDKFMAAPLSFNYTGYRNGATTYNTTDIAFYWSRTAINSFNAYNLDFRANGYFDLQNNYYKHYGFAVRCVAAS